MDAQVNFGTARIYVGGPMTGLPEFNYPAFNREASRLRAAGYHVENPADNETPPCNTWAGWMRLAIAQLITCDTLVLLDGWAASRGAVIEERLARDLDMRVCNVGEIVGASGCLGGLP